MSNFFSDIFVSPGGPLKYYVDGAWKSSTSGKTVPIINPSTGKVAYEVQACTTAEVDQIFLAARAAQPQWSKTPLWRRVELLRRAAEILRENKEPIAECLVREVAKPYKDAIAEVERTADLIIYTAEEGSRHLSKGQMLLPDAFPGQTRNKLCLSSRVPHGIVLCIPPFNYPVNLAASKIAPALMAGNAVVLKPPTQGAVAGVHMLRCFSEAGFPPGLINLATGRGSEIGDYMTMHQEVDCVSFTGGDTGLGICRKLGMVPIQMELGGKDVCIVCEDADLDVAVKHILKGAFSYSGQRCTAVKAVLVQHKVADVLVERLAKGVKDLRVGSPEGRADVDIVPVVSASSADFIEQLSIDAANKGAEFVTGPFRREGNLIWPSLIDKVTTDMRLAWEEPFGPILPVIRISNPIEGVEHCNRNRLALQGCVFTQNLDQAIALSDAMRTGTVQINAAPARGPDHFPFQGFRDSGIGSQGVTNSLDLMTKVKSTVINLKQDTYTLG
mmetsp:Transcript_13008/g.23136  ORF Transcript_13008/g.23136 Transcript_13008/m.23136 type:complete len:500 (-) Transcript_13008:217-1716(-)|eukprot:CAMPEP_0175076866 /NCGR_PEP_ID=MMETSP0052_2-20121109/23012_1 /TAXON_ID=51329 ORGANISM="Polytomella parva, Strain SAG 63-3" /NCGR_SAMPLE_ID=MMETSP0052_2 /ASSEMBLY_ACC=CAM_ASM_000194 /LENGTH=499 /DNA_ID=CAMNT_0016346147 /DNA_START=186 /DNA_END=1685 /DNA_ORIENTATION=+